MDDESDDEDPDFASDSDIAEFLDDEEDEETSDVGELFDLPGSEGRVPRLDLGMTNQHLAQISADVSAIRNSLAKKKSAKKRRRR
jgi:hypothetical protein